MKHVLLLALLTCVSVVAASSEAAAQERKGWFGSIGIGAGATEADTAPFDLWVDREWARVTEVSVGWAFNKHVLAGLEVKTLSGDIVETPRVSLSLANVSGTLWIYPTESNFFIKGGAGPAYLDADVRVQGIGVSTTVSGFGVTAGAGYDIHLGGIVSLTPAVGITFARPGELAILNNPFISEWKQNTFDFTVSIKFN